MGKNPNFSLAYGTKSNPHLGQSQEMRVHWAINTSSMSSIGGHDGASFQSIPFKRGDLGSSYSYYEKIQ